MNIKERIMKLAREEMSYLDTLEFIEQLAELVERLSDNAQAHWEIEVTLKKLEGRE